MFYLAFFLGIYSYFIFLLGVLGFLYKDLVIFSTWAFLFFGLVYVFKIKKTFIKLSNPIHNNFFGLIFVLILTQLFVNLIGVMGPELSFDALWYHLTLPKIYLESNSVFYIPGGLLYYSAMPKLAEMLYVGGLAFGSEVFIKFLHFSIGIVTAFSIYKISQRFVSKDLSLVAALIFYSNLVVGWESITSYIDLFRAFFETLAFWAFIIWIKSKSKKFFISSAVFLGLAITTKLFSVFSLFIFLALFLYKFKKENNFNKHVKDFFIFSLISLSIVLPWLMFSYLNTGDPIYPYFSLPVDRENFLKITNVLNFSENILKTLRLSDPISSIYLIIIPLIILYFKKMEKLHKYLLIYTIMSFLIWYITQLDKGGRFLLPYLPVWSVLTVVFISRFKNKYLKQYLLSIIIFLSVISIGYRFMANAKYIPVILGIQTKQDFLAKNLDFNYGDYYDISGYFKNHISKHDKVLLYGFHNLYYVEFPYVDSSWVKKGDKFNYIAVQNTDIPKRFSNWKLVYGNDKTKVRLYTNNRKIWTY